jgi:hypothetical protein
MEAPFAPFVIFGVFKWRSINGAIRNGIITRSKHVEMANGAYLWRMAYGGLPPNAPLVGGGSTSITARGSAKGE